MSDGSVDRLAAISSRVPASPIQHIEKARGINPGPFLCGVSDGTRTRDHLDHNQVLYQLSYTHHGPHG